MTDDAAVRVLLERVQALETALVRARSEASENLARAIRAEQQLPKTEPRAKAPEAGARDGTRWWQRSGGGKNYSAIGDRIVQLLLLAEEQSADMLAVARAEADQIRSAAVADAARIRESAV